jgi:hypothetical protein
MKVKSVTVILAAAALTAAPLAAQQSESPLPVQRVVLYKSGIGYFEHVGRVSGDEDVTVSFTSAQLDDVLKTLTVLDLDGGRVGDIGYNSLAPLDERLRNVRLPLGERPTFFDLLDALRGARIEVRTGNETVSGRVLSAERHQRTSGNETRTAEEVTIVTDDGDVRRFEIGPQVSVRLLDADLRAEMTRYLGLLESTREEDVRRLTISTQGSGARDLFVSYVSEVPIWKSSYRIVVPSQPGGAPILQGWAIVDNTIGEDWDNVELSLVGGSPQSFIQQISQPYYARRPVVPLPDYAQSTPQTHAGTLTEGSGRIAGLVMDQDGAPLPGVTVTVRGPDGVVSAHTRVSGEYALDPLPPGRYDVIFTLQGFKTLVANTTVGSGRVTRRDARMQLGTAEETVTVSGRSPVVDVRSSNISNLRSEEPPAAGAWQEAASMSDTAAILPSASYELPETAPVPIEERVARGLQELEAAAGGQVLGDLFEYRLADPVTIRRNESALVPILRAEVAAEKVSLWSARQGSSGRPVRALWLTNASDLPLDGGSFTVIEDSAFAGEGLLDSMEPGERRLLSYGTDVAVLVDSELDRERGAVTRVTAERGVLVYETAMREERVYAIRNQDSEPRTVIVEHPARAGWEIVSDALPEETAPGVYRFRVTVDPQQTATLNVAESRPLATRVELGNLTDDHVALLVQQGVARAELEQTLRPILDKKAEIAVVQGELRERNREVVTIERDQSRVRENLQALGDSAEERSLRQRYVSQLEQQEDRLETLRGELRQRNEGLAALQVELIDLIGSMSFEIDPAR